MGYYTEYRLDIVEGDDYKTEYMDEVAKISGYGMIIFREHVKWYNHEEDMIDYSKQHPNTVFALMGDGDAPRDKWVKYFKNGKMHKDYALKVDEFLIFDEYNESKLV